MLEKALESLLDCSEIKPVNLKGNQSWIFIGRTDAEASASILWPPDVKSRLIRKDPDPGKDWWQEKKGTTEDGMVGWHHRLNGNEFEQALGVGEGQGSLAFCSQWSCKESDMTEWLKNNLIFRCSVNPDPKAWLLLLSGNSVISVLLRRARSFPTALQCSILQTTWRKWYF